MQYEITLCDVLRNNWTREVIRGYSVSELVILYEKIPDSELCKLRDSAILILRSPLKRFGINVFELLSECMLYNVRENHPFTRQAFEICHPPRDFSPLTQKYKKNITKELGGKAHHLQIETLRYRKNRNFYLSESGQNILICLHLGDTINVSLEMDLTGISIPIHDGDVYIPSESALNQNLIRLI